MDPTVVFDCIVVGAGIEGSATAFELSCRHLNVLLLDQFSLPHTRGSSHGATRITRRAYHKPQYSLMMTECYQKWSRLEKLSGQQLYKKTGVLVIGPETGESLREFQSAISTAEIPHETLDSAQLSRKHAGLSFPEDYVAILEYDGGTLKADKCLAAYQAEFKKRNGQISDEEKILRVVPGDTVTLHTSKGVRRAKNVVFCVGPWAGEFLLKQLHVRLPLETQAIKVCYWNEKYRGAYSASEGFPCVLFEEHDEQFFALPADEYEGLLKFCYHSGPLVSADARDSADAEYCVAKCQEYVAKHLPLLESRPAIIETCLYTVTPDKDFILDRHPAYRNLFIGAGFSGHGFKLAPAVGGILADLVCGITPAYPMEMFQMSRFNVGPTAKL